MRFDLPTPEQILEELADKTATHIERLSPVAFDNAFEELVAYHRFLFALSASHGTDQSAISFTEVSGGKVFFPHEVWIRQYRRLYERAASCMPEDDHFIRSLAYTPIHLLPPRTDAFLPVSVVSAILDLGPMMIHRLEAWITKRTVIETEKNEAAQPRLALAGSDAKAYANVLPKIMGAWERVLEHISLKYVWPDTNEQTERERWSLYQASWPLLWRHLTNTAYCLAITAWNEDERGTRMFCEALVRWPLNFEHKIFNESEFQHQWLLYPTIFHLDWTDASEIASSLANEYEPRPSPNQIFANAIRAAHHDVVLLTAALLLFWTMNDKHASDLGGRSAKTLLFGDPELSRIHSEANLNFAFGPFFLNLIRLEVAGDPYNDDSYEAYLNRLIHRLDNMTERRVVPGRAFSPSTLDDRQGLAVAVVTMLTAALSEDLETKLSKDIDMLAQEDKILPDGDGSLRNVLRKFGRWDGILEHQKTQLHDAIRLFVSDERKASRAIIRLREIIKSTQSSIERARLSRLKTRRVDPQKLERIRVGIESALLSEPMGEPVFQNVPSEVAAVDELAVLRELRFRQIRKAQLVEPPMETPSASFEESLIVRAKQVISTYVWEAFYERSFELRPMDSRLETQAFWDEISELVDQIGPHPVMAVSQRAEGRNFRRFSLGVGTDWPDLSFERLPPGAPQAFYIGTVGRVRIYGLQSPPGRAWLFSATALRNVRYAEIDGPGRFVDVAFEPTAGVEGTLRVRVRQQCEWRDSVGFELVLPETDES